MHSEVLTLTWANVTTDAVRRQPGATKSGAGREWPLRVHPELRKLIADQKAYTEAVQKRTGQIVPWVWHREGRQIRSLREAWAGAAKRAGLTLIPHDLRRSAARNMERAGVPRSVIMRLAAALEERVGSSGLQVA
jgi:integrase